MAEEEDPWAFDENDTAETAPAPAGGDAAPPPAEGGAEGAPPAEGEAQGHTRPHAEDDSYRKPVQLYRHWVRPQFLQYRYMYNYRTNYYDDVIDYLDKRQKGVKREPPRAQTWAERVLRTNTSSRCFETHRHKEDPHLIQVLAASIRPYNYHTKAYINLKYSNVI